MTTNCLASNKSCFEEWKNKEKFLVRLGVEFYRKPDPATEDSGAGNAWMKQERSGVTISEESGKKPSLREVMRKNLVQEE